MNAKAADVPAGTSRDRDPKLDRARGCLIGQIAGDSLGSLVEFQSAEDIRDLHPEGIRDLRDGGTFDTQAGQPTDDSEMALALARTLIARGTYDPEAANRAYCEWLDSDPFDCGLTIRDGLLGNPRRESQANGALMRIAPLGIFGSRHPLDTVARWAREDARLTHPNRVCLDANALFAMALAHAIDSGPTPRELYERIAAWANEEEICAAVRECVAAAAAGPPDDYMTHMGWVLIALRNALWQLRHAPSLEEGVIDSVMRGGDTDTNAAICGALLGAVHGLEAVPARWTGPILRCRPEAGRPGVRRPRPKVYWPTDALNLATQLLRPEPPAS
ncbi:MAG: ADP-ribosylglycohydrolase family protein [Gemmatimonadota bacterium]|uniref:ADP-ribosylglycohydrolase family protein n=1 Tax=Candidatus Palauibacter scopulicola TaxID=3056741 RepID=UPI00239E1B32|nr:ADP-ribosylglycohydrolase family protein [Candidatus Palauibacter scopulicola]MDE2663387.1 ADP-ribosylglycohydrolase family protein [Candidatus Palauibacter scopulicola]